MTEKAARVGLQFNSRKCKTLMTKVARDMVSIVVDGKEVEDVGEFAYLGAIVNLSASKFFLGTFFCIYIFSGFEGFVPISQGSCY